MDRRMLAAAALAVGCAAQPVPTASEASGRAAEAGSVELASGVVIAPARGELYLMAPAGGIEAVALADGRPVWHSRQAARPLALAGGRLLAQAEPGAGGLRLELLETAGGGAVAETIVLPLPPGARAPVDQALGERFELSARALGAGLIVDWSYELRPVTGVSPPPGAPPAVERHRGAALVDPAAATAQALTAEERSALDPPPAAVARRLESGAAPVQRLGARWLAVTASRASGELAVRVQVWDADGRTLADREAFRGRGAAHRPSADGRHLMVGVPAGEPATGQAQPVRPWRWQLIAVDSGEDAGSYAATRSLAPFLLTAETLIHLAQPAGRRVAGEWQEEPLRVTILDRASGSELWSRAVRDTAFRGPRPPAAGG